MQQWRETVDDLTVFPCLQAYNLHLVLKAFDAFCFGLLFYLARYEPNRSNTTALENNKSIANFLVATVARVRYKLMLEKHMIDFTSSKAAREHFHTFKQ